MNDAQRRQAIDAWRAGDPDEATRAELDRLVASGEVHELDDRFGARLEFGTAGLRGVVGAGPNRMNRAVVLQTTRGLADWLLAQGEGVASRGVVVGYDARLSSLGFAEDTAAVLAAAGIPVHLFDTEVPTPLVAYAVLALRASAGVVVTASHNPPEYNGYKVYAADGAQIVPPVDVAIARAIDAVGPAIGLARVALDEARARGVVREVPASVAEGYLARVASLALHPELRPALRIVYTPLHGVGFRLASAALARAGFSDVEAVPEQREPDGRFPTVAFPNPEEPGAMDLALALARATRADLVLANDPDADRLAVAVPDAAGRFVQLTGNQVGVLLGHYLLTEAGDEGDRVMLSTIVSSPMLGDLARALGVRYEETLTGFKWIARRGLEVAHATGARVAFGYEEALGYSVGDLVRDKDGIGAAVLFADLAATCRARGRSVLDELESIYRRHGLYASAQRSIVRKGVAGIAAIGASMAALRAAAPLALAGREVLAVRDYAAGTRRDTTTGLVTPLTLPPSDVVALELAGGARVVARPSGTEPKLKIYLDVREAVAPHEPLGAAEARAASSIDVLAQAALALLG